MNTSKQEVWLAINSERKYQDRLGGKPLTIGEELLLIEEYAALARKEWTLEWVSPPDVEIKTLGIIRKIAALSVRCMENNGAPFRISGDEASPTRA